uniref:Dishevelled n=1 Tax=Panagrolaimus sp. PS1159 TaxID=55785 RepID=A0AC35FB72_9BILA
MRKNCRMLSEDEKTTKVYYYLDGNTPFVSVIPVHADKITLGDFKKVFEKQNYKYFCKEFDSDLNKEVKVELTKDDQKLNKSQNGLIQLVLLPIYPQLSTSGNTLPRSLRGPSGNVESFKLKKRASAQALSSITDEADIVAHRVSLATDPSAFTSFSRRAGEHLADVFSSDEDDDPILAGSNESSNYGASTDSLKHGKKNNREPKAYVPSTISSVTHSSSHSASLPRLDEIKISMKNAPCLGIQVVDSDGGIFVSNIKAGSAADQCGLLEIGDQICQINNVSFEYLTIHQAVAELQKVARSKRTITMFVAKRPNINDQKSDGLSGTLEATMPLDVSGWVETTKTEPSNPFQDSEAFNRNYIDDGGITSDEERAAYIDRRNGAGNILVSALTNCRNKNCFEPSLPNPVITSIKKENDENELFSIPLTLNSDPTIILRRMVHPKSSLEIADRKWLKIPFPNSFIGNDLIHWLLQNVSGFKNKKHAVNYANVLLNKGYIRHVLDGKQFDKKRYYFFEDSIIAYRKQNEQFQQQNNIIKLSAGIGSATTEITYLGSPTYPLTNQQQQKPQTNFKAIPSSCGILPEPSQHQFIATQNSYLTGNRIPTRITQSQPRLLPSTSSNRSPFYPLPPTQPSPCAPIHWPISPVLKRTCDSPQTNDYASMIQGEINSNYIPITPSLPANMGRSASPPPNTPNTLSANSSTALLTIAPKFLR